jgi:hypothetical protein
LNDTRAAVEERIVPGVGVASNKRVFGIVFVGTPVILPRAAREVVLDAPDGLFDL